MFFVYFQIPLCVFTHDSIYCFIFFLVYFLSQSHCFIFPISPYIFLSCHCILKLSLFILSHTLFSVLCVVLSVIAYIPLSLSSLPLQNSNHLCTTHYLFSLILRSIQCIMCGIVGDSSALLTTTSATTYRLFLFFLHLNICSYTFFPPYIIIVVGRYLFIIPFVAIINLSKIQTNKNVK